MAATAAVGVAAAAIVFFVARRRDAPPGAATFARITAMPGREWFPSLSPDGKWVVYGSDANGNFDVYLQSVSGANPVNLTPDSPADDDMPAFSPDGERIAFRSSRDGGGIFVMGRTGEAVRRLTRGGFNPAWSPDGAEIAFTTGRMEVNPQNSEGLTELFVVGVTSGEPRRLVDADAIQPSWSPHKKRIVYGSRLLNNNRRRADLWTVPVGGGTPTPVLEDLPYDWNPVWSPDGGHVYFISDRGGTMNLWRVAIDEDSGRARGAPEPVPTPAPFCAHPAISADGKHFAYSSVLISANVQKLALDRATGAAADATWVTSGSRLWSDPDPSPDGTTVAFYSAVEPLGDLYLSGADGTQLRQLTSDAALDRMPHWSPDGLWISMFSNRSGRLQIWKIRPDGSDLRQVTDDAGGVAYSTWSPDSRRLAVVPRDVTKLYIVDANRPWSEQRPEVVSGFPGDRHEVRVNSWSSDGNRLAGDLGQTATVRGVLAYTFSTRKWERLTEFGEWPVWFPDSRRLLFGDGGKSLWVVDSLTREVKKIYSGGRDVLGPPRLTRDGRTAFYSRRINESDIWLMTLQ
jgi:Tol biopolymer transport system component